MVLLFLWRYSNYFHSKKVLDKAYFDEKILWFNKALFKIFLFFINFLKCGKSHKYLVVSQKTGINEKQNRMRSWRIKENKRRPLVWHDFNVFSRTNKYIKNCVFSILRLQKMTVLRILVNPYFKYCHFFFFFFFIPFRRLNLNCSLFYEYILYFCLLVPLHNPTRSLF